MGHADSPQVFNAKPEDIYDLFHLNVMKDIAGGDTMFYPTRRWNWDCSMEIPIKHGGLSDGERLRVREPQRSSLIFRFKFCTYLFLVSLLSLLSCVYLPLNYRMSCFVDLVGFRPCAHFYSDYPPGPTWNYGKLDELWRH
jgi:hypothetical protein